ncbi:hypothetical protein, partial [Janthinobacterium sp.]|uniref:hypothetical protein n=1 Tax=Janthinobacterium sp. TaxID=1871054 RepID=UPI00293D29D1
PKEYNSKLTSTHQLLGVFTTNISLDNVKDTIRQCWLTDKPKGKTGEESAFAFAKRYKGTCYNCGKQGHKDSECRSRKSDNNEKRTRGGANTKTCFKCKKPGHIKKDFQELKKKESSMFIGDSAGMVDSSVCSTVGNDFVNIFKPGTFEKKIIEEEVKPTTRIYHGQNGKVYNCWSDWSDEDSVTEDSDDNVPSLVNRPDTV